MRRGEPIRFISHFLGTWWICDPHQHRYANDRGYPIIDLEGVKPELLQAAPELLKVAEAVLEWWKHEEFRSTGHGRFAWEGGDMPEQVRLAREAIAKALGESQ